MIVSYSSHGKGGGGGAGDYLTADEVLARDEAGQVIRGPDGLPVMYRRDPPPVVLRGDVEQTVGLIDALVDQGRERTYSNGVLSFAPGEWPSEEQQQWIMGVFEQHTFAGLEPGQYDCLWVRHEDKGRLELNYLIPRVELTTGKALNPDPPGAGNRALKDAMRDYVNETFGWAGPTHPSRQRAVVVPDWRLKLAEAAKRGVAAAIEQGVAAGEVDRVEEPRVFVTRQVLAGIEAGAINSRDDVVDLLVEAGFEIPRKGREYVTALDPVSGERFRLRGAIYAESFTDRAGLIAGPEYAEAVASAGPATAADGGAARADSGPCPARIREAGERLEALSSKRAAYNRKRYHTAGAGLSDAAAQALEAERSSDGADAAPDLGRFLTRSLGVDALPVAPGADAAIRNPLTGTGGGRAGGTDGERAGAGLAAPHHGAVELLPGRESMHRTGGEEVTDDTDGAAATDSAGTLAQRLWAALEGLREAGSRVAEHLRGLAAGVEQYRDALAGFDRAGDSLERAHHLLDEACGRQQAIAAQRQGGLGM